MDIADHAHEREAQFLQQSLEEQQRASGLDQEGAAHCADCGEPIPAERRAAMPSAFRCVNCQAWVEQISRSRTP